MRRSTTGCALQMFRFDFENMENIKMKMQKSSEIILPQIHFLDLFGKNFNKGKTGKRPSCHWDTKLPKNFAVASKFLFAIASLTSKFFCFRKFC